MNNTTVIDRMTPKAQATRQKVLEAARTLMRRYQSQNFSLTEVAALAGLSKGALYYYFADKTALIQALFEQTVNQLVERVEETCPHAHSAREGIELLVQTLSDQIVQTAPLALALSQELLAHAHREPQPAAHEPTSLEPANTQPLHITSALAKLYAITCDLIARGQNEGSIRRDVDADVLTSSLLGSLLFTTLSTGDLLKKRHNPRALADLLVTITIDGLKS